MSETSQQPSEICHFSSKISFLSVRYLIWDKQPIGFPLVSDIQIRNKDRSENLGFKIISKLYLLRYNFG